MEDGNRLRVDVVMMRVQYGWWNAVPSAIDAGLPINTGNSSRRETLLHMAAGFFSKHGTHECDLPGAHWHGAPAAVQGRRPTRAVPGGHHAPVAGGRAWVI